MGRAVLEATSNDLDPDFGWFSLRLKLLFCPNLGDLEKKVFTQIEAFFFFWPNLGDHQKKRSSARLRHSFSGRIDIRSLPNYPRQS